MPTTHEYPVTVEWSGGREGGGEVTAENSGTANAIAVPTEFQGTGKGTNPEELLTSAIAACYTITYGIIAQNRKVPVARVETRATGEVEQNGAQFVYTSIKIVPTIAMEAGANEDQIKLAEDMAHKADVYCIITNAVRDKVKITVEPKIV